MTPNNLDRAVRVTIALLLAAFVVAIVAAPDAQAHTATVKAPVVMQTHPKGCDYEFTFEVHGCTYPVDEHGVYLVFVRDLRDRMTVAHELGHVYDWAHLTRPSRAAWSTIFGRPFDPELFAEGYARCENHTPTGFASAYGYDPSRREHRALCRLIWTNDRFRNG